MVLEGLASGYHDGGGKLAPRAACAPGLLLWQYFGK